jgi:hypothetical protein
VKAAIARGSAHSLFYYRPNRFGGIAGVEQYTNAARQHIDGKIRNTAVAFEGRLYPESERLGPVKTFYFKPGAAFYCSMDSANHTA